jgi:hypothetical protein
MTPNMSERMKLRCKECSRNIPEESHPRRQSAGDRMRAVSEEVERVFERPVGISHASGERSFTSGDAGFNAGERARAHV